MIYINFIQIESVQESETLDILREQFLKILGLHFFMKINFTKSSKSKKELSKNQKILI